MAASVLEQLLKELQVHQKHNTPSGTPSTPYMHGAGGLFSVRGLERDVISSRILPRGIASTIAASGSVVTNPLFSYISGFQNTTGSNPQGVCDDPRIAGALKNCVQTAQFGRYSFMTRELELNRLGQQTDRGEFLDLRLVNDPLLAGTGDLITPNVPGNPSLNREVLVRMMELGVAFQNQLIQQVYIGNPANNTGGGGYKEFPGLDILIGTDKYDAISGTRCPALDSDIKNFNYSKVDAAGGDTLINVLTYMMRMLRHNADRMNLSPVEHVITMRTALFWELTAIWPCSYLTYRCQFRTTDGTLVENVSANDAINFRDSMRQDNYLLIDGVRFPVILDDGIVEESSTDTNKVSNTCFASDIYVIPLTIVGGMASTYFEYLDYSRGAMIGAEDGNYTPGNFWTDGGRYLWHAKPAKNWCVQWVSKVEPRLILLTPQLAGRVLNVQYCPLQHERSPFPNNPYFVDGGATSRPGPSLYSDWNKGP